MAILVSPGVSVTVVDESFYDSAGPGTVPLIVIATASNKVVPDGTAIAQMTEPKNASKVFLATSQRELLQSFGDPIFREISGTQLHGNPTNEYGLLAAHSYLGVANRAFILRADVDLNELQPRDTAPTANPINGTYWLNTDDIVIGLAQYDASTDSFEQIDVDVISDSSLLDSNGVPIPSAPGAIGSFALVPGVVAGALTGREENQVFRRASGGWELMDANNISESIVYRPHTQVPLSGEVLTFALTNGGSNYAVGDIIRFDSTGVDVITAASVVDRGSSYALNEVLSMVGGTSTVVAQLRVTGLSTVASQTHLDFVGSFNGGTGYANGDTITLNDGTIVTVVAEAAGVVTEFTVTSASTSSIAANLSTLTQSATSGAGAGFTLTLAVANQGVFSVSIDVGGNYTVVPSNPVSATSAGLGVGATFTVSYNSSNAASIRVDSVNSGTITHFTVLTRGSGYTSGALTQTSVVSSSGVPGLGSGILISGTVLSDGDFWVKTTKPNTGTEFTLEYYDGAAGQFVTVDAPLARSRDDALLLYLNNPQVGDLFTLYDHNNETVDSGNEDFNARIEFSIMRHNGRGTTRAVGTTYSKSAAPVVDGDVIIINGVSVTFTNTLNAGQPLELIDTSVDTGVVGLINNASIPGIVASVETGALVLTHVDGKDITVVDGVGAPIVPLFGPAPSSISVTNGYVFSNWSYLSYEASNVSPTGDLADDTLWYSTDFRVDLLSNNGQGQWDEVRGQIFLQPAEPTIGLSVDDIWIDTDQLDEYPVISTYNGTDWVQLDNADQVTPRGIVFADARPSPLFGTNSGLNNGGLSGFPDLDADCPDPLIYPRGTILFNTRYSTLNVKRWVNNYTFNGIEIGDRWVNESGNKADGSPYMGDEAVRRVITLRMAAAIASNDDVRAKSIFYNLMAAPGYPELIDELITLNVDRKLTSFIVGDTPFTLKPDAMSLQSWATNANGAETNGTRGLLSSDTYLGVYYPSALTTNIDGAEVVVPPSHVALRTIAFNDQVSYQWFAPAGYQRGVITNAVSVGYVNDSGEYVPVELNDGQLDTLYLNNINPFSFRPNQGLFVFGQKTRHPTSSALDRINVVRLINYLRYRVPQLLEPFLFEPNDGLVRRNVEVTTSRFLAELITLRALQDFAVVCDESNNTPARIDRNELWVDIAIVPLKALEFIYVPIRVRNSGSDLSLANPNPVG